MPQAAAISRVRGPYLTSATPPLTTMSKTPLERRCATRCTSPLHVRQPGVGGPAASRPGVGDLHGAPLLQQVEHDKTDGDVLQVEDAVGRRHRLCCPEFAGDDDVAALPQAKPLEEKVGVGEHGGGDTRRARIGGARATLLSFGETSLGVALLLALGKALVQTPDEAV